MSRMLNESRTASSRPRPSVPRNIILMLSGILIGLSLDSAIAPGFQSMEFAAGFVGIVAYFVLDTVKNRRQVHATQQALQVATQVIDRRISRHLPRTIRTGRSSSADDCSPYERSFLTVSTKRN